MSTWSIHMDGTKCIAACILPFISKVLHLDLSNISRKDRKLWVLCTTQLLHKMHLPFSRLVCSLHYLFLLWYRWPSSQKNSFWLLCSPEFQLPLSFSSYHTRTSHMTRKRVRRNLTKYECYLFHNTLIKWDQTMLFWFMLLHFLNRFRTSLSVHWTRIWWSLSWSLAWGLSYITHS